VPPGALGISRGRQANIDGWVERKKKEGETLGRESSEDH
jgi:bifunctional N-acetylglucosamine-1-phosphate-uridyltransferase/glucosamine-1-phosphate-acetyltransferase GlmU-like protein